MPLSDPPDYASVLGEVRVVRRIGIMRLRGSRLPALTALTGGTPVAGPVTASDVAAAQAVERLLARAVAALDGGTLREAAEYSLGLAPGTRDWPPADRRRHAARLYGVSVERFRKHQEVMVLGQVAEHLLRLAGNGVATAARPGAGPSALPPGHRSLLVTAGGRDVRLHLHVHSADLLRDVDVVVSPTNTHLALPGPFKSSVAASLRRAGAERDAVGGLVADSVHAELERWAAGNGAAGRPALPGTVAATGPGALIRQGIRRIYHAVVAVPLPGTNDYTVLPADVTRACARVFALLRAESAEFDPPLRSVCFPLLGSGRGGLSPESSLGAVWAAVEAELARGAAWDVHLVVRRPERAELVERLLSAAVAQGVRP